MKVGDMVWGSRILGHMGTGIITKRWSATKHDEFIYEVIWVNTHGMYTHTHFDDELVVVNESR
jgi:hypothetical protein